MDYITNGHRFFSVPMHLESNADLACVSTEAMGCNTDIDTASLILFPAASMFDYKLALRARLGPLID